MARDLQSPRIQFNWGYHDAANELSRGRPRKIVDHGPQSTAQVSREWGRWYAIGYEAGLTDARCGEYYATSTDAWLHFLDGKTAAEVAAIRLEIFECERDGLAECLRRKPTDHYVIERAHVYTAAAMIR